MNIGKSKAYHERRKYLHDIAESAKQDRQRLAQELVDLDPNTREPTVHGGCMFLLDWYRTYMDIRSLTNSLSKKYQTTNGTTTIGRACQHHR